MRKAIRRRIPRLEYGPRHRAWLAYTEPGFPIQRFDPEAVVVSRQVGPPTPAQLAELRAAWDVLGPDIMRQSGGEVPLGFRLFGKPEVTR